MSESSYPWTSLQEGQWNTITQNFLGVGVLQNQGGGLAITANATGMNVTEATGNAWVNGVYYTQNANNQLTIAAADPTNPRIDAVVIDVNYTNNTATCKVLTGTPAPTPSAPTLTQTTSEWQILLAYVNVAANATTIAAVNVTDKRTYASPINSTQIAAGATCLGSLYFADGLTYLVDASGNATLHGISSDQGVSISAGGLTITGGATSLDNGGVVTNGSGGLTISGNVTNKGIVYFANGTTYGVDASGNATLHTTTTLGTMQCEPSANYLPLLCIGNALSTDYANFRMGSDSAARMGIFNSVSTSSAHGTNYGGIYFTDGYSAEIQRMYGLDGGIGLDGNLTIGTNLMITGGKTGVSTAGDVLDASGFDTYLKARGGTNLIHFQQGSTDIFQFENNGLAVNSYLGIKTIGGTKLAEAKNNGTFIIGGNTYYTATSTYNYSANGSFDSFDVCEEYPTDRIYEPGHVVCPDDHDRLILCTHDNCPFALVISAGGAFHIGGGQFSEDETTETEPHAPVALVGRVKVATTETLPVRSFVVSDGHGGIRRLADGECGNTLGFTLTASGGGKAGIFVNYQQRKEKHA